MARILVVHRDEVVAILLKTILEKNGYEVEAVSLYGDGVEKARGYNLIFAQGSELWLHGDELIVQAGETPVVMVSGGEEKFFSKLAKETGCQGFIALPAKIQTIVDCVKKFTK